MQDHSPLNWMNNRIIGLCSVLSELTEVLSLGDVYQHTLLLLLRPLPHCLISWPLFYFHLHFPVMPCFAGKRILFTPIFKRYRNLWLPSDLLETSLFQAFTTMSSLQDTLIVQSFADHTHGMPPDGGKHCIANSCRLFFILFSTFGLPTSVGLLQVHLSATELGQYTPLRVS